MLETVWGGKLVAASSVPGVTVVFSVTITVTMGLEGVAAATSGVIVVVAVTVTWTVLRLDEAERALLARAKVTRKLWKCMALLVDFDFPDQRFSGN